MCIHLCSIYLYKCLSIYTCTNLSTALWTVLAGSVMYSNIGKLMVDMLMESAQYIEVCCHYNLVFNLA